MSITDTNTLAAPATQGDALDQGVREELSIGKAINRAARDLPEIGSLTDCEIGDWLRLRPLQPNAKVSGAGTASAGLPG